VCLSLSSVTRSLRETGCVNVVDVVVVVVVDVDVTTPGLEERLVCAERI
jgi:hypothetical protein